MASSHTSNREPPSATTMTSKKPEVDESESEWEYEYSTTENETYYVTLDLSKADFVSRQQRAVANGRGGYKEKLLGEAFASKNSDDELSQNTGAATRANGQRHETDDDEQPSSEDETPDEVQVLDLHSAHPLISYRGRLYEGAWSENIGTELLITRREENNPLPAVRQLDNGVDLLAASSARITVTEKDIKPRDETSKRRQRKVMFDQNDYEVSEDDIYKSKDVPRSEPGASQQRIEQGNFLANLIALKKRKGETDEVTVVVQTEDQYGDHARRKPHRKRPDEAEASEVRSRRGGGRWPAGRRVTYQSKFQTPSSSHDNAHEGILENAPIRRSDIRNGMADEMEVDDDEDVSAGDADEDDNSEPNVDSPDEMDVVMAGRP